MNDSTDNLRTLLPAKLAASQAAHSAPLPRAIAETPTALAATKSYNLPLTCSRTGILVGNLNIATIAGHMPMIGQWKETMVLHPLFSLEPVALLHFARNSWFRFCNFSLEEGSDEKLTAKQEQILQVAALAMLHNLSDVRQDVPWMPTWQEVSAHWTSLMAISYWKAYLDSARFRFPALHISKLETPTLREYLQVCWNRKKEYETVVNDKIEEAKLRAAEAGILALRAELAGVKPTSNKQIWRWFVANLPARYSKDIDNWMEPLFFSKGEDIREYTMADIDLLEQIFLCECPTGSSLSHAFSEILAAKRNYIQQHFEAFEIIIPKEIVAAKEAGTIPIAEPQYKDFKSKALYMIAAARWRLAHTDIQAKMRAALDKQQLRTVAPSHVPELKIGEQYDLADEDEDEEVARELAEQSYRRDDNVTGEYEE